MKLWLDPSFGASGNMLLGALSSLLPDDAPDPLDGLSALGALGFSIDRAAVLRCGLSAHLLEVNAESEHHHRAWSSIDALLAGADLPPAAADGARATFHLLAEVEAAQHSVPIDEVHFHEVGAVDALIDIVGTWLLLDTLDVDEVTVGPIGIGYGTVRAAHGLLPLPAPATARLLTNCPIRSLDVEGETCTPTGAALLVAMADRWGVIPSGAITDTARGAGTWNPPGHPNVVTAMLIDEAPTTAPTGPAATDPTSPEAAVILDTNVDDVTGEDLGHTITTLLAAGADDAWVTPIVMKKSRPAHVVSVLCAPQREAELRTILLRETGALGCRSTPVTKHVAPRERHTVLLHGHEVAIKTGPFGAKPEFDDLAEVSQATGQPLRVLRQQALDAFHHSPEASPKIDNPHPSEM